MHDVPDQLREWSKSLADTIEPADLERVKSPRAVAPDTRRWLAVAASVVIVAVGFFAVARLGNNDSDRISPVIDPPPTVAPETTSPTSTTEPQSSSPDTTPVEVIGGVRFPVVADEQDAQWIMPWNDGFLVGAVDLFAESGERVVRARFTTDGASWESVEMSTPPGLEIPGRVASVGDRFIMAGAPQPSDAADVFRVASTTDLINWSVQDFEVPGARPRSEVSELGGSFTSMGSFAANETGWTFEVVRIYSDDVTVALPDDVQQQIDKGVTYRVRSDDAGFSVAVDGPDGSLPTAASTYEYTWDEVGITPDSVPYMTGEIPSSRTWAATWDGAPAVAEGAIQRGPTLASPEGFVRWNDNTWFSADGLTWAASPLPDPNGTVQNAFAVDGGFVAIVRGPDGTSDVYRLDERGGNPRLIEVEGLPQRFAMGFAVESLPSYAFSAPSAAVLDAGHSSDLAEPPLIIDSDGYRLLTRGRNLSVIDLATGETILTQVSLGGAPGASTIAEFHEAGMLVTDPATETVLMEIPIETFLAAQEALQAAISAPGEPNGEPSTDLQIFASTDGERFLLEDLRSSNPDFTTLNGTLGVSTNGQVALVRLGDEWIRYELVP